MLMLKSLAQIYNKLRFDPRLWQVLEMRVDKLITLEDIGKSFGITRERVRQIERRAWVQFTNHSITVTPLLDLLERNIQLRSAGKNELISNILGVLHENQYVANETEVQKLILLTRALVFLDPEINRKSFVERRWPRFSYLTCKLKPPVVRHYRTANAVKREKKRNKKITYKEMAFQILTSEGAPLHWSEIAKRAYHLRHRESFNSTALYNALVNFPKLFVRVNPGTYALVEWGYNQVDTYADIIALIMKSFKKALSAEAIYHKVNEIRPVKQATLTMSLEMHPRFYKSLEKTYGLRVWLPPREKQTLRTPEWLVEDSTSYKRLEQASQRGYNINSMIQVDLDLM
jgi:hypothetical protein